MALTSPKTTLLHAVVAATSQQVTTIDDIILTPNRLPPELLLIIRTHLLKAITIQLYLDSTRALAEYEASLQSILCPDCVSYNYDIYGPDVWQWQQFSGPCACVQKTHDDSTTLSFTPNPQQFLNPSHWLEHHLFLQATYLSTTPLLPEHSIWDVVIDVLHRHHCEPLKEDIDDFATIQGNVVSLNGTNPFSHHRLTDYYYNSRQQFSPAVRIRPLQSSLRLFENQTIGELGDRGDLFRTEIILNQITRELALTLELEDVFGLPKEPPPLTLPWSSRRSGTSNAASILNSATLLNISPILHGAIKTYAFLSAVLGAFISMPMTIATVALTVICFYSRPIALRVGL